MNLQQLFYDYKWQVIRRPILTEKDEVKRAV